MLFDIFLSFFGIKSVQDESLALMQLFLAFFCVFFVIFGDFGDPFWVPKSIKNRAWRPRGPQEGPRRLPGGPRGRFWGHLGLIWGAFWSHLGAILEQIAVNEVDLIACGLFRFLHQLFLFLFLLAA